VFRLKLNGVLDLGRHDFDERYILVSLKSLQAITGLTNRITGMRIRIQKDGDAEEISRKIESNFGSPYFASTWKDSNSAIFEAIQYEKPVIFFIVLLISFAAAFNIATSLFVSVFRRYREISILRTAGATQSFIVRLFATQGMLIGSIGGGLGVLLGLGICSGLEWVQKKFPLFPGDVYRIDKVILEVRPLDLGAIVLVSMLICFLAALAPAFRGARLKVVEGLRYE
jgi:lipoprotein-releasing system permease protein